MKVKTKGKFMMVVQGFKYFVKRKEVKFLLRLIMPFLVTMILAETFNEDVVYAKKVLDFTFYDLVMYSMFTVIIYKSSKDV